MLFISVEDFFEKALSFSLPGREEEIELAIKMKNGDSNARQRLMQGYLPVVAGHIKHRPSHTQTLGLVLYCVNALEKAVDSFDFLQDSETFVHRLSWHLRQASASWTIESR